MVSVAVSSSVMEMRSSGQWAQPISPAPYITHGIPARRTKKRMSAPKADPSTLSLSPVTRSWARETAWQIGASTEISTGTLWPPGHSISGGVLAEPGVLFGGFHDAACDHGF